MKKILFTYRRFLIPTDHRCMLYLQQENNNGDLFFVKCSHETGLPWFGIIQAKNACEAGVKAVTDFLKFTPNSPVAPRISLGLFIVVTNVSKVYREECKNLDKKEKKFVTVFRASELLADSNQHALARIFKMEEDNFLKEKDGEDENQKA